MKTFSKKGFTLVEVLIAMFILSIGIMAVVGMLTMSLRAGSFGRSTTVANRLVQQQIEQVRSMSFPTMQNFMCGLGVTQAPGFTGVCIPVPPSTHKWMVFTNRTAMDVKATYKVPTGGISGATYTVTMEIVKNYPVSDVDMITAKAEWRDMLGSHDTTAVTYVER